MQKVETELTEKTLVNINKLIIWIVVQLFCFNISVQSEINENINNNQTERPDSSNSSITLIDTIPRTDISDFTYGNHRMYTITGELPKLESGLETIPSVIVFGSWTALFATQHFIQMGTIWQDQGDFKIQEDGNYALGVDKLGHIYGTYFTSYIASESLMATGMSWELSTIIGTSIGLGYQAYIEILDGFGENWGFSPSDFYCDIAGAFFFLGQYYIPFLQNFTPKFMYVPPKWYGENDRVPHDAFIDNYSAHTFWLSMNVHNILPGSIRDYWPEWLELAVGYAARNLSIPCTDCPPPKGEPHYDENGNIYVYGDPKYIIALDVNLVKLLPDDGSFFNWFKQTLDLFKLPTPAVEFGKETRFYLLYPFKI